MTQKLALNRNIYLKFADISQVSEVNYYFWLQPVINEGPDTQLSASGRGPRHRTYVLVGCQI